MRIRLILLNSLIVLLSLVTLLIVSITYVSNINESKSKDELRNYLSLSSLSFDGSNYSEVIDMFKQTDKDVRVTFINLDGKVLYDTIGTSIDESHIDRKEITNLGTIVKRHSTTLNESMIYIATRTHEVYLRVAIPTDTIDPILDKYVATGLISLFIILTVGVVIMWPVNKEALKPLNEIVANMEKLTGEQSNYKLDSLDSIQSQMKSLSLKIEEQLRTIKVEKDRIEYIVNILDQGLIVLNKDKEIEIINNSAIKIFNLTKSEIINKNYIISIRDCDLQNYIEDLYVKDCLPIDIKVKGFIYMISGSHVRNKVILMITDVTKVRNIEQVKREFFANASHELKSPLTSIIGFQQMISEGIINDEAEIKNATLKTIKEATRMNNIIIEMLELSKLESKLDYKPEKVLVKNVVKEIVSGFDSRIKDKQLLVNLELNDYEVLASHEHIYSLLKNIIDNAIKYNKESGNINVKMYLNKIEISDSGVGIPKDDQARIFERFYRVDKNLSKELGGTGLGLSIVKHICALYNYKVNVDSDGHNYTKFTIEFNESKK